MRILKNETHTLTVTFYSDETPITAGAVAVSITDLSGSTVSTGAATEGSTGVYTYAFTPVTNGLHTVTWDGDLDQTTYVEVVGSRLFTLEELRLSDDMLDDAGKFTTAKLKRVRDSVEDEFEMICGRSFITRRVSKTLDGAEGGTVLPHVDVTNILTVDGSAYTGAVRDYGVIDAYSAQNAVVYEYGLAPVPADVKRVALIRARHQLAAEFTGIPDRATSYTPVDGGTYALATPGRAGNETGIPEVDAVLGRYRVNNLSGVV